MTTWQTMCGQESSTNGRKQKGEAMHTIFQKRTEAIKRLEDAIFATGNVDQIKRMPDGHIIITFILPVAIGGRFSGLELDGLRLDARQGLAKALAQGLAKIKSLGETCKN